MRAFRVQGSNLRVQVFWSGVYGLVLWFFRLSKVFGYLRCAGPGFMVRTGDSADVPDSASAHRRLAHKKYPPRRTLQ